MIVINGRHVRAARALLGWTQDELSTRAKVAEAVGKLRKNAATSHLPVIAFADEKEEALQTAARDAGATLVVNEAAILSHLEQFLERALQLDQP